MSLKSFPNKNLVYMNASHMREEWTSLFKELKLEVISDEKLLSEMKPYYIVTKSLMDIDQEVGWECKIYTLESNKNVDIENTLFKFYGGTISLDILNSAWGKELVARAFNSPGSFDLSSQENISYHRWNCNGLLSFGTFSDQILMELVARDYKIDQVKKYLDELFFFYAYAVKAGIIEPNFEIQLILQDEWASLQMISHSQSFWHEYSADALKVDGVGYAGCLNRMCANTLALEVLYLHSSRNLCLTSLFDKKQSSSDFFLMQNLDSFALKTQGHWEQASESSQSDVEDVLVSRGPEFIGVDEGKKLANIKKIIKFLEVKLAPERLSTLDFDQVKGFVADYPNKKLVRGLVNEDYKFIVKCLKDKSVGEEFKRSFDDVHKMNAEEDFLDGMLEKISNLTFEDAGELIFDGHEDFSETLTKVGGWVENLDEINTIVKGSGSEKESVQIIKGERVDLGAEARFKNEVKSLGTENDQGETEAQMAVFSREQFASKAQELWEVKRLGLSHKIKDEVEKLRAANPTVAQVAEKVREIVKSELKIESDDCETFVKGIVDFSSTPLLEKKLGKNSDEVREELENLKFKLEVNKKDDQIRRMKRIIDGMKEQIGKQAHQDRTDSAEAKSEMMGDAREWQGKLGLLEKENEELKRSLKALELQHERAFEIQSQIQQKALAEAASTGSDIEMSQNVAEEIIQREREKNEQHVEAISSKLSVAESRIEVMSSKLEEQRRSTEEANSQRTAAESRSNMSAAAMSKFKAKAESLEKKVRQLEETLKNKEDEIESLSKNQASSGGTGNDQEEKIKIQEKYISELKTQLAEIEKNLKGSLLKNKQYEHKAKFMSSQLEEAQKARNSGNNSGASGAGSTQQLEHKLKQLENMNRKMGEASQKLNDELTDKKKEVLDLKKENMALQNKLKEFERKSGKKAA